MPEAKESDSAWIIPVVIILIILLIILGAYYVTFHPIFTAVTNLGANNIKSHPANNSERIANTAYAIKDTADAVNAAAGAIGNVVSLSQSIKSAFGGGSSSGGDDGDPYSLADGESFENFDVKKFWGVA